jgi:BirA family biotin operon repressor/biotin-[acetyl-CoA-carboxylase] ligase
VATTDSPDGAKSDLSQERVEELLAERRIAWRDVTVLAVTGSTNADLMQRWLAHEVVEGAVVAAGAQRAGRGRLGRVWESPPGAALSFSVLLTPPAGRAGFIPVLTAVAVARAVSGLTGLDVSLKWPNDLMLGGGKLAGILAEGATGGAVVGCGINVSFAAETLPVPTATSLNLHGATVDRSELLVTCLGEMHAAHGRWREAGYDAVASGLLAAYRASCGTIGREVRVSLPDGSVLAGMATAIDDDGRLVVLAGGVERTLTVGDVIHVRGPDGSLA